MKSMRDGGQRDEAVSLIADVPGMWRAEISSRNSTALQHKADIESSRNLATTLILMQQLDRDIQNLPTTVFDAL